MTGRQSIRDGRASDIERLPHILLLVGRNILHARAERGEAALLAKVGDSKAFEGGFVREGVEFREGGDSQFFEFCEHGAGAIAVFPGVCKGLAEDARLASA